MLFFWIIISCFDFTSQIFDQAFTGVTSFFGSSDQMSSASVELWPDIAFPLKNFFFLESTNFICTYGYSIVDLLLKSNRMNGVHFNHF